MFERSKGLVGFNLGMNVRNAARMFPNKEALVDAGKNKRYTYRELNGRVNSAANALLKIGVKKANLLRSWQKTAANL